MTFSFFIFDVMFYDRFWFESEFCEFWIWVFVMITTDLSLNFQVFESCSDFEVQVIELSYLRSQYCGFLGFLDPDLILGSDDWTVLFWEINIMDFSIRIKGIYEI